MTTRRFLIWKLFILLGIVVSRSTRNIAAATNAWEHSPVESTKQFYNSHVDDYIANIKKAGVSHVPREHALRFVNLLKGYMKEKQQKLSHAKILEIGCGYGREVEFFCNKYGMNVIGTDYSRNMLIKAQELVPYAKAHFLELDMRNIAFHFLPNSLDGVWACATIMHIPKEDISQLFADLYETIRPGGIIYVSVKLGEGESFVADDRYGEGIRKFYAFYTEEELLMYMKESGFEIVESGVSDHRDKDEYATHPFIHVFATKPPA